jgi:hypothetical protein
LTAPAIPPNQLQVQWNYDLFSSQFPEFSTKITAPQAYMYWMMAAKFQRNDGGSPITNDDEQALMLNLLTAHIATLIAPDENGEARGVVGRLTSFSEGSASGSVEFPNAPDAAWYLQTTYGAMWWEMTAGQRTMFYRSAPRRRFNVGIPFPFIGNW